MNPSKLILAAIIVMIFGSGYALGQDSTRRTMPEVFDTGTIQEQFDYLDERTRIYNNFRAIREDMFQKIKSNSADSLMSEKNDVIQLENRLQNQDIRNDSMQAELQATNVRLDEATKNRDRLTFLGIPMHKALYNTIVWIIIAALTFLSVILILSTRRIVVVSRTNKNDLEEIKEEFEDYRKTSRERYEKLAVQHHNEIRKLKGNQI